jgi:hypothetical protein
MSPASAYCQNAAHGDLKLYGETLHQQFRVIWVIGREPNTSLPIHHFIDSYDFEDNPHCGFWNTAYSTIEDVTGMCMLKEYCIGRGASPIACSDALPIGIPNAVRNKRSRRLAVPTEGIQQHVDNIFSYQPFVSRVGCVLLTGLHRPVFQRSEAAIHEQCNRRNIPFIDLPFFHGTNAPAIRRELRGHRALIADIVMDFDQ